MTRTRIEIDGQRFLIDGRPTYPGREWHGAPIEGLLLNARMVQATFDDENELTRPLWSYPDGPWDPERNTREFMAALPSYRAHGLLAVTLNLQGGCPTGYYRPERLEEILAPLSPEARQAVRQQLTGRLAGAQPWHNSAFDAQGRLKEPYLRRLALVLDRLDALGMVAILGVFYFGQDERLEDERAVRRALDETVHWLLARGDRHVLLEVNNECNVARYEHEILRPHRVHELIAQARAASLAGRRLLAGTSYGGGRVPDDSVVAASDFILLHGNGVGDPARITQMVDETRALPAYRARPMPILFNEDDHFDFDRPRNNFVAAVERYASWGFFDGGAASGGGIAHGNYHDGFQLVPVDWRIGTPTKQQFFALLREMTGETADCPAVLRVEAEEQIRETAATLRRHAPPRETEPAFWFRA